MVSTRSMLQIREKTERSLPLRASMGRAGSMQSPADSEVSSILSSGRRSSDALTPGGKFIFAHSLESVQLFFFMLIILVFRVLWCPNSDCLSVVRPASRSSGRGRLLGAYGSRPGSRSSRPPSRAGSDVSEAGSLASRDSLAAATPTRIPSARKKWKN